MSYINRIVTSVGTSYSGKQLYDTRSTETTNGGYNVTYADGNRIVWSAWMYGEYSHLRPDLRPCEVSDADYIRIEHYSARDDGRLLKCR